MAGPALPPAEPGPAGAAARPRRIATPDQRLRVFVSSTIEELAAERRAVREAVERLRLTPVLFELGARPHPPRDLYRAYLAQSDVFVGVYGERYGWVAPDMDISGLEDELRSSEGMPRLLYVRRVAPGRDPRLTDLIARTQEAGGASTTPYDRPEDLAGLVADDLAVLLTERFAAATPGPAGPDRGWLPSPPAPMVGRAAELQLVTGLLADPAVRLVTVTGPGGTGKTRLALAAAECVAAQRDGVWWVDLAAVRDPAEVPAAVAGALGVLPQGRRPLLDVLTEWLAGRHALLVIDNAEHVLAAAAPAAAALLARCPRTQLLVTSRSVLGLRGEQDVPLGPLPVPAPGEVDGDRIRTNPAVALFVARARRADPAFALREPDVPAVAEVVRRLDGLPLALELAAARSRTLPPAALLRRLGAAVRPVLDLRGSDVDAPERQRTIRDTIAWSHDLLPGPQRALLARLSVCSGGCTLDTAEAIGSVEGDLDVLETLASLVGHSLVTPADTGEGEPRFRMLGLVRAFAGERLADRGEAESTQRRLAEHLAGVSAVAGPALTGPGQAAWRARLDAETGDLLGALRWAVAADRADLAVAIAAPLARWWWSRGLLAEMAELAEQTAALPSAGALAPGPAAALYWARGATRIALGRADDAAPLLERQVELARTAEDPWLLGHGLVALAMALPPADPGLGDRLTEAVAAMRRSGDRWSVAYALIPLGDVALLGGDLPAALRVHHEALELARDIADDHLVAAVLDQLGFDALLAGDTQGATARLVEAADLHRAAADLEGLANCLGGLAALALSAGAPELAARLAGAAGATRTRLGVTVWPLLSRFSTQLDEATRAAIGADADRRARAAGASLDPWAALDEGLAAVG